MYIQNILDKEDCNSFIQKFQKIYSETGYKIIQRILTKRILIKLRIRDRGKGKKNRNFRHDSMDSRVISPFLSRSRLVFHSTVNGHDDVASGVETAIIREDKKKKKSRDEMCVIYVWDRNMSGIRSLRRSRAAKLTRVEKKKKY